jgi:hypothetical protein
LWRGAALKPINAIYNRYKSVIPLLVAIHQPNYLPWLGFFNKIKVADKFIVFNTTKFSRGEYFNRNRIRVPNKEGYLWLSIPIPKDRRKMHLNELDVSDLGDWGAKHLELIGHYYNKTKFFDKYFKIFEDYYADVENLKTLDRVNWDLTKKLLDIWNIDTPIVFSSELEDTVRDDKTDRLLNLLQQLDATAYYSGKMGFEYMSLDKFKEKGVEVVFQEFSYKQYPQVYEPFIPDLSAVDLLFNTGEQGRDYF